MITITRQLDGERLNALVLEGFPDETVLVVPLGDVVMECAFRVMAMPSHTQPTDPPRAASLDEVAEAAWKLGEMVQSRNDNLTKKNDE